MFLEQDKIKSVRSFPRLVGNCSKGEFKVLCNKTGVKLVSQCAQMGKVVVTVC